MSEHPILFSGPMIRAILAGTKTMTRRICNPQPGDDPRDQGYLSDVVARCPYGGVGDRLWVRETWRLLGGDFPANERDGLAQGLYTRDDVTYRADAPPDEVSDKRLGWRPSIFLPRWASRLTLEVAGVRVERLKEITAADIMAEGAVARPHHVDGLGRCPVSAFDGVVYPDLLSLWARGWDKINGKRGPWASNPYVYVVSFRRIPCR